MDTDSTATKKNKRRKIFSLSASTEERAGVRSRILRTDVFATRESWQDYSVNALYTVWELAKQLGIEKHFIFGRTNPSAANHWPTGCRIPANI